MDFGAVFSAFQQVEAEKNTDDLNAPIAPAQVVDLNPESHLALKKQQEKENELSRKARKARNKAVARSQGYYDRIEHDNSSDLSRTKKQRRQPKPKQRHH